MSIPSQRVAKELTKVMLLHCLQMFNRAADVLPRCPKDLPVIIFTVNGKDNQSKDFHVCKQKVSDALHWLVGK